MNFKDPIKCAGPCVICVSLSLSLIAALFTVTVHATHGEYVADEKKIINDAVEQLSIEIARDYLTDKKAALPSAITSFPKLVTFLSRTYPDPDHELRRALSNLKEYGEAYVPAAQSLSARDYLNNGVRKYAVNLRGEPLAYSELTVSAIIDRAEKSVESLRLKSRRVNDTQEKVTTEPQTNTPLTGRAITFIRLHSLPIIIGLIAANALLFVMILRLAKSSRTNASAATRNASLTRTVTNPQMKIFNPDLPTPTQQIIDNQATPSRQAENPKPREIAAEQVELVKSGLHQCGDWLVVRASVAGKLHVDSNPQIPCQDSSSYEPLRDGWGIAVVCDGAGSKKLSHLGSQFVADSASREFARTIERNGWLDQPALPSDEEWHQTATKVLRQIKSALVTKAETQLRVDPNLLSCTIIVVVHSPLGTLACHVGDGRAAFADQENNWKPLITPQKGEEANQTFFITSIDANGSEHSVEATVGREEPIAFTLLSDGCESHSFEVNIFDEAAGKYFDPNRPYEKFFNPLVATLINMHTARAERSDIEQKWVQFLSAGNPKLSNEPDDKTMILGVRLR